MCLSIPKCSKDDKSFIRIPSGPDTFFLFLLSSAVFFLMSDFNTTEYVVLKSCFHILYSFPLLLLSLSSSIKVIQRQKTCPSFYLSFLCSIYTISITSVFFFRYYTSRRGTCLCSTIFLIFLCIPAPLMFRSVSVFTRFSLSIHF